MTGLLNLFGLCTMEQLHRNMDEVVGVKHELARREAEIGELKNEVSRTMSAFRDERSAKERYMQLAENERLRANKAEMDCKELAYKMEAMQADLENTEKLYRETVKKLRVANGRMGAYKQQVRKKTLPLTPQDPPPHPSQGRGVNSFE